MPFISVEVLEGHTGAQLRGFVDSATAVAIECLGTEPEKVRIRIIEISPHHIARAGRFAADEPENDFKPQDRGPVALSPKGHPMPLIRVEIVKGRTLDQRRAFARALTESAATHLGADPASLRIRYIEMDPRDVARNGTLIIDKERP